MTDDDPGLDLTVPFDTDQVVKAAEHIFNQNCFNKHLREGRIHYSTTEDHKKGKKRRPSQRSGTNDERLEKETEEEDEATPFWIWTDGAEGCQKTMASPGNNPAFSSTRLTSKFSLTLRAMGVFGNEHGRTSNGTKEWVRWDF